MTTLATIAIPNEIRGTGKCKHVRCGEDVSNQVASISLVELDPNTGYYLFYKDILGRELNDLFFDTMHEAVEQIEFEYGSELSQEIDRLIGHN